MEINDAAFVHRITSQMEQQINEKQEKGHDTIPFKIFFRYLLKAIADYQEETIVANFMGISNDRIIGTGRKQTFLSYAYYDKGLTQALFYYFWIRSGLLYVNWMWEGKNNPSAVIKKKLEDALKDSDQFLFLRTTNSELRVRGNNSIRQWCSWEIGNFYTKNSEEKYYTSFYDKAEPCNDILDTFKPMKEVIAGRMI